MIYYAVIFNTAAYMHIMFMGQRGIPAQSYTDSTEKRVEALASLLSQDGHTATVTCSKPYYKSKIRRFGNMRLVYPFTFNPEKPGGLLHIFSSLFILWRTQPDVAHIHGWKTAVFVRFAALLSPETTFIWTISYIPASKRRLTSFIAWQAKGAFDAISTPYRQLQYQLLVQYNLRCQYIPDGYVQPRIADTPAKHWDLRKGQYCATTATGREDIRWIAKAYSNLTTRKKLVVLTEPRDNITRLQKQFPFLIVLPVQHGRAYASLIRQAAVVIATNPAGSAEHLLHAMDAGRAIIATSHPFNEELLGTNAQIVKQGDTDGLLSALRAVVPSPKIQNSWGSAAQKRAQNHFHWHRIVEEYKTLYHYPVVRRVPLDSVRPVPAAQQSV
jgi:glycosyltransferase involved in cell wall biosynthesis